MAENAYTVVNSGQEVQDGDVTQLGVTGGLADDHILAELVRLLPYTGPSTSKLIIPYTSNGSATGSVAPTGSANGSILINPFRAIVGSRNSVNGAPAAGNITTDSDALANWRDIRSGIFTGSATSLTATIALTPNSSGNPRWDLVCAAVTPDSNGPSVSRRVKNPTTSAITVTNVPEYIYTPITVSVVTGTPGATPALPALPADGAGIWYIPLAYVRVPNGFSGSTTVSAKDIRSTTNGSNGFANLSDSFDCFVGSGNNDENTAFNAGGLFPWNPASAGSRPGPWMGPDWRGGKMMIAQVDNLTPGTYSHANLAIVDSTVDWRKRYIFVVANYGTTVFGTDPTATAPVASTPGGGGSANTSTQLGNSFVGQNTIDTSSTTVWNATIGGVAVGLLVHQPTGNLIWNTVGAVGQRFGFMIFASGQMPNA